MGESAAMKAKRLVALEYPWNVGAVERAFVRYEARIAALEKVREAAVAFMGSYKSDGLDWWERRHMRELRAALDEADPEPRREP